MIRTFLTKIPHEYKQEFHKTIYKHNLLNFIFVCIGTTIAEAFIYLLFYDNTHHTDIFVLCFILFNIIAFPFLFFTYKRLDTSRQMMRFIDYFYLMVVLIFGCSLSVVPQNEIVTINTYIIVVFGSAAFIFIPPLASAAIYLSVYLGFFLALPYYQANNDIVEILRVNAFIMNFFAWLLSRIGYRARIVSLINKKEIETKNLLLKKLAIKDSLTSLINHENSYKRLHEEVKRSKRIKYPLSVMMLDIDNYKAVNDQHGHQVGDEVVVQVSNIILDTCRTTDIIGRYGGDEFITILPNTAIDDAVSLAERVRMNIKNTEFKNGVHITVSGGIAEFHGESVDELIKNADTLLYKAKANGRNRFETA